MNDSTGGKRAYPDDEVRVSNKRFCLLDMKDSEIEWQLPDEFAQLFRDRCQKQLSKKDLEPFFGRTCPIKC